MPGAGFIAGWIAKPHGSGPHGTVVKLVVVDTVTVVCVCVLDVVCVKVDVVWPETVDSVKCV